MRNYLVYVGLLVSGGAVFATYQNIQSQKDRLRRSIDESDKFKTEVKDLKLKMFALNGQIQETTASLLQSNDASSIAIAEKLQSSTGQLLSANYSTSNVINDLLKEQNDSLKRMLTYTISALKQSIAVSENNMKEHMKSSEAVFTRHLSTTESAHKIEMNNLEEKIEDGFEETKKQIDGIESDTSSSE